MEGFIDWNKLTTEDYIKHLENEFKFSSSGTAKAVFELIAAYRALNISDVVGSLPLVEIDKDVLKTCVEMYKTGDKITAVKWLMEEAKKPAYTFGIKWAKEYLEKQ